MMMNLLIVTLCLLAVASARRTTRSPSSEEWRDGDTARWCQRSRNRHLCASPSTTGGTTATTTAPRATTQPPGGWNKVPKNLPLGQYAKIKSVCAKRDCTAQAAAVQRGRSEIVSAMSDVLGARAAESCAEKTFATKVALFDRDALASFVAPYDDGTYNGMLLTERQSALIVGSFQARSSRVSKKEPPPAPRGRKRRNALFFPDDLSMKWDSSSPIAYLISSSFTTSQVAIVERALADIMHKSCVAFTYVLLCSPHTYIYGLLTRALASIARLHRIRDGGERGLLRPLVARPRRAVQHHLD